MLAKMRGYMREGKLHEALIIGQNLFAKNSGDREIFEAYIDVLKNAMRAEPTAEGKMRCFRHFSSALAAFSVAVDLDDSMVAFILSQEDLLDDFLKEIQSLSEYERQASTKKKIEANDVLLAKLPGMIAELRTAKNRTAFDDILLEIQRLDAGIDKDCLTDKQRSFYEKATKQCSELVNDKLHAFRRAEDAIYNEQALEAYERVYQMFKTGDRPSNHKDVIRGLFAFDPKRLFGETLTYYNQVYAYVLSKMNDDEKFILTKAAIVSNRGR